MFKVTLLYFSEYFCELYYVLMMGPVRNPASVVDPFAS